MLTNIEYEPFYDIMMRERKIILTQYDRWGLFYAHDTYQNALICCSHHHRFLHYHHGGSKNLIFEDGQVFWESRKGTRVRIVENLHLTEKQ